MQRVCLLNFGSGAGRRHEIQTESGGSESSLLEGHGLKLLSARNPKNYESSFLRSSCHLPGERTNPESSETALLRRTNPSLALDGVDGIATGKPFQFNFLASIESKIACRLNHFLSGGRD